MSQNRFILKIKNSNLTIKGGFLNDLGITTNHLKDPSQIIINEELTQKSLEQKMLSEIRKKNLFSYLRLIIRNKIGSILTVLISLIIILIIAILSIHGSITYDLFSSGESSNILNINGVYLYIILSVFVLFFLVFAPRIFFGEYGSLLEWANNRFSTDTKISQRLQRNLNTYFRINQITKVTVWNPLISGQDSWITRQLLPAFANIKPVIALQINVDDKNTMLKCLKEIGKNENIHLETIDNTNNSTSIFPIELLPVWEKECLQCLYFSSTLNLPPSWQTEDNKSEVEVSKELAERVFQLYETKFSAAGSEGHDFGKFFNRCISDYNYIVPGRKSNKRSYTLNIPNIKKHIVFTTIENMADVLRNNQANSIELSEPLSALVMLGLFDIEQSESPRRIKLAKEFIKGVLTYENYNLLNKYWNHFSNTEEDKSLQIMQFLDTPTLNQLSTGFVNAGMYENALEVYDILENIYPAKIAIEIADLKDSLGEYEEALEILLQTDKIWMQSGMVDDQSLILLLYLNISWVIVSGRFTKHRNKGYAYLEKTNNILRKLPNMEDYLTYLTRYYNTLANYHEWEQEYEKAIENYEKALKLPGSLLRKSSLTSNRGIAERLLGVNSNDVEEKKNYLTKSKHSLQKAVSMKKNIGEKNQIPGSSHNLSETLLELTKITSEKKEKINILSEVDQLTKVALQILNELNSEKRRGRLLTEQYIAHCLLSDEGQASEKNKILPLLIDWFKKESPESYDYRETSRLLNSFGIVINN